MQCLDVSPQFVLHLSVRNRVKCCFRSNPHVNKTENCFPRKKVPYLHGSKVATEGVLHKDTLLIAFYRLLNTNKNIPLLVKDQFTEHVRLLGPFILDHIYKHYFTNKMAWVTLRIFCKKYRIKCGTQAGHYLIQNTLQLPQFQIVVFCLLLEING